MYLTAWLVVMTLVALTPAATEGRGRDAQYYLSRWSSKNSPKHKVFTPSATESLDVNNAQIPAPPGYTTASRLLLTEAVTELVPITADNTQILPPLSSPRGTGSRNTNSTEERDSRLSPVFSLFNMASARVRNVACTASSGDNGTCYSTSDCARLGVQLSCGGVATQNCTYFVNSNYPTAFDGVGSCQLTVNKIRNDICQLRLDFDTLTLSQPENNDHQCVNDRFTVSGGTPVPTICGTNTGNHMYVDLGPGATTPSVLTFVTMGPSFERKWKVKVTQIPCNSDFTAPTNCLQYYQGVTGQVKTYNYDLTSGLQLSNQDYTMCIRTEKNFCGIQYMACTDTVNAEPQSFSITGSTAQPVGSVVGAADCTRDWVTIPCVSVDSRSPATSCQDRLCGDNLNTIASTTGGNVRVFSFVKPFILVYHTDSQEASSSPAEVENRGFCLDYVQQPCV
ncbi:hypothetical protein Hamer_G016825 [Homarus americanus]|uniref:CUB domain-containing protein n=1 Tax=Homarus americanus TaxID=6706 RepID=A0A8J5K252_HOMAM|nr:hypothetical protein Hamer_G016825 [Homarus americanus]